MPGIRVSGRMRTFAIRYERSSANAMKIAEFLESHEAIEKVLYPGLLSHSSHEIAKKTDD